MSEDDLPRTIIVLLAVFSIVSFAAGSTLEMVRPDLLFRHPYWGNLISGMTGFTTSGFIISVLFRRIQRRHQRRAFAGHAGPEINQIALEADACMRAMLSELGDDADLGGVDEGFAAVRAVKERIGSVREDVAMRPVSIIRLLVILFATAIELSSGNRFPKDVLRDLGLD